MTAQINREECVFCKRVKLVSRYTILNRTVCGQCWDIIVLISLRAMIAVVGETSGTDFQMSVFERLKRAASRIEEGDV